MVLGPGPLGSSNPVFQMGSRCYTDYRMCICDMNPQVMGRAHYSWNEGRPILEHAGLGNFPVDPISGRWAGSRYDFQHRLYTVCCIRIPRSLVLGRESCCPWVLEAGSCVNGALCGWKIRLALQKWIDDHSPTRARSGVGVSIH